MRFVHTADWQIGKPFARIDDPHKRSLVRQARVDVIDRIGAVARDSGAAFVLVAGDLFDSSSADKATVSAACSAIGRIELPVFVIPGNHDHGGPGCVWEQEFFRREQAALAPNLTVLLEAAPVEHEAAIILPCPLLRRTAGGDPVAWLGSSTVYADLPADKPRIVLAHGSVQRFTGWEDEGENDTTADFITVDRILDGQIDYIALGDWHGTKQVGPKAWYSGAPESDRFPKGEDHDAGNILVVDAQRGSAPTVSKESTGKLAWIEYSFDFADDPALDEFEERLTSLLGQRAGETLLHLTLSGSLGLKASDHLGSLLDTLEARLLRLKLADRTVLAPTEEEIEALTQGGADPLIARVARRLVGQATGDRHEATGTGATAVADSAGAAETAAVARLALRELHAAWAQETAR